MMSHKGKTFTAADFPEKNRVLLQRAGFAEAAINARIEKWATENTERYRVLAVDGETKIIREEIMQRAIDKLTPKARRIAGALMAIDQDTRAEVMRAFYENGDLKLPFKILEG